MPISSIPLRGGAVTAVERALLDPGKFSWLQNMRNTHPGLKQRKGQRKLHTTADGTNQVKTLYQFNKNEAGGSQLFAQMSDGDILEATTAPPGVTTGAFGSEVLSGSAGQRAASWGTLGDILLHSNGVDQHKLYGGSGSNIDKFIVYAGAAAAGSIPTEGKDYSNEVRGGNGNAVLDSLPSHANHGCFYIKTPLRASAFHFTIALQNGNAAVLTCDYRKNDNTWAEVAGGSDGTAVGGATLQSTGTFSFTMPTDEQPHYQYHDNGWWYRFRTDAALDASVEISKVTYTAHWQDLENVWNGIPEYPIEVWVEGTSQWYNYAAAAVDLDVLALGKKIILLCTDPIEGIYVDVGATPNDTGTALTDIKYTDGGGSFASVGTIEDESNGFSSSGWISFPKQSDVMPVQFEGVQYYAYVYEITLDSALAADTQVGLLIRPYFDIEDYGKGNCNCVWQGRGVYSFDKWQQYLYVSATNAPMVLNGADYGILEAGDGRSNRVVGGTRFYNEMIVWQIEEGKEGGCTTLFQGYSPTTFGKLVLSSRIGGLNAKAHAVVDGVMTATRTDEEIKTLAFWLSRYGVIACDGRTVYIISDSVQNYFDPSKPECIRRGYEDEHWLEHDSAANVLRIGLVSGSSATTPNVFLVFDLVDKTWSFDTPEQELSCMTEASAGSGDVPVVQLGGGVDDGMVYQLNYGNKDVDSAIDSYVDICLSARGNYLTLLEYQIRCVAQDQGTLLISAEANGLPTRLDGLALPMTPERSGQTYRRNRKRTEVVGDEIVFRIRNNEADIDFELLDVGFGAEVWTDR